MMLMHRLMLHRLLQLLLPMLLLLVQQSRVRVSRLMASRLLSRLQLRVQLLMLRGERSLVSTPPRLRMRMQTG